jgi:hypothetical protein
MDGFSKSLQGERFSEKCQRSDRAGKAGAGKARIRKKTKVRKNKSEQERQK